LFIYINRKEYVLHENLMRFTEIAKHVECIQIHDENTISTCKQYFRNTNQLLLSIDPAKCAESLRNILENLMPVKQLTNI